MWNEDYCPRETGSALLSLKQLEMQDTHMWQPCKQSKYLGMKRVVERDQNVLIFLGWLRIVKLLLSIFQPTYSHLGPNFPALL